MAPELQFVKTIHEKPQAVYRMFTNPAALREWLCDRAYADARQGGPFFVVWNSGYFASGAYNLIQPDNEISFTWRGKDDPDTSQVRVLLDAEEGNTRLSVLHSGLGESEVWASVREEIRSGWETALENLVNVLERGPDLRIINRPMLGVVFGGFSPELAEKLNVPVRQGIRLDGVLDGLGAQMAGLQKDDVLVEMDGKTLTGPNDISAILQGKRAGERVEAVFYRGTEKQHASLELARRPLPEIPMDAEGLASAVESIYHQDFAMLEEALKGVNEEETAHLSNSEDWTIKEVLAHLIINERWNQLSIVSQVLSSTAFDEGTPDNLNAQVKGAVYVYGTVDALLEAFKHSQSETIALLRNLPADFTNRKSSMWACGYDLLSFPYHTREHAGQIRAAVESARVK